MEQLTRNAALRKLIDWADMMRERDARVIAASDAGLTHTEISATTGLARSTVHDILRKHKEKAADET